MNISSIPVFRVAKEKMNFLSARQTVLAQNVANVDTPGYIGRDLKAPDFARMVGGASSNIGVARTNVHHLPNAQSAGAARYPLANDISDERNPDNSRVQLDDQLKRVAETQMQYNIATSIYRKQIGLFRTALGSGQGG